MQVCDDFSGYKACFELGITEAGCLAHARRKFHERWGNHGSPVGEQALKFFGELYEVERAVADLAFEECRRVRQEQSRKVAEAPGINGSPHSDRRCLKGYATTTAKAIDYGLKRWVALTSYIDAADLPVDNNQVESQIRPIALGGRTGYSQAACALESAPPQ